LVELWRIVRLVSALSCAALANNLIYLPDRIEALKLHPCCKSFKLSNEELMHIRTTTIAILVILSLLTLTLTPAVFAQRAARSDWTLVQSLLNDEDLSLKLRAAKALAAILDKGKQEVLTRDTIAQIYQLERKAEKGKYAAIGAGIGAGVGLGIGAAKNSPPVDDGRIYPIGGAILGAGIGAVGGLLFGQAKRKHVLIYEAP
jgi:hypothetical protein